MRRTCAHDSSAALHELQLHLFRLHVIVLLSFHTPSTLHKHFGVFLGQALHLCKVSPTYEGPHACTPYSWGGKIEARMPSPREASESAKKGGDT